MDYILTSKVLDQCLTLTISLQHLRSFLKIMWCSVSTESIKPECLKVWPTSLSFKTFTGVSDKPKLANSAEQRKYVIQAGWEKYRRLGGGDGAEERENSSSQ